MPNPKRSFVNPLTQPSTSSATYTTTETSTLPSTDTPTLPATYTTTETSTLPDTFTSTYKPAHRKRGAQAFEKTHERVTLWMDKNLKGQFEALADKQGVAKSTLLDEAIGDLLRKHGI